MYTINDKKIIYFSWKLSYIYFRDKAIFLERKHLGRALRTFGVHLNRVEALIYLEVSHSPDAHWGPADQLQVGSENFRRGLAQVGVGRGDLLRAVDRHEHVFVEVQRLR